MFLHKWLFHVSILLYSPVFCTSTLKINTDLLNLQDPVKSVSEAMTDVIRKFFIDKDLNFDFIIYGNRTQHNNEVINELTKNLSSDIAVNIKCIEDIDKWKHKLSQSAVFLTVSLDNLRNLNDKLSYSKYATLMTTATEHLKFLVYVEENTSFDDVNKTLQGQKYRPHQKHAKKKIVDLDLRFFEFIIINNNNSISLSAHLFYSDIKCNSFHLKVLNNFDKKLNIWSEKLENYDHYSHFHGCLIPFAIPIGSTFYPKNVTLIKGTIWLPKEGNGYNFQGITSEILNAVSTQYNFTIHYTMHHLDYSNDVLYFHEKNIALAPYHYIDDTCLFRVPELYYTHCSTPFKDDNSYFLVSQNDLYTNYEKLLFPFDTATWILIVLTYGFTFGIILGLQLGSRWIRTRVFGKGIINPAYNALAIFFGISQVRLPNERTSRYLWLFYIWFCLMIRTCYQSKMFEFMTTDMRHPLPESINDLVKWNYTVIVKNMRKWRYSLKEMFGDEFEIINAQIVSAIECEKIYEAVLLGKETRKFAFFLSNLQHLAYNRSYGSSLEKMKNVELKEMSGMHMVRNNMIFVYFNRVLDQFISTGIAQHLDDYGKWLWYRSIVVEDEDPRKVLTMDILEFGFVLWLAACFVAFLVFICECRSLWMKRKLRILIGLIDFLRVLWHRLQDYHDRW